MDGRRDPQRLRSCPTLPPAMASPPLLPWWLIPMALWSLSSPKTLWRLGQSTWRLLLLLLLLNAGKNLEEITNLIGLTVK